jgi:hypothetical protein
VIERPRIIYIVILLWLVLSVIFVLWGVYSLVYLIDIPNWTISPTLKAILHFGYLMSTIVWFVFSSVFLVIAYGTLRKDHWVWTTGVILTTIFLAIFALMLTAFIINALRFFDEFSVLGLVTVVLSFITDLGLIFHLTRPNTKKYFEIS